MPRLSQHQRVSRRCTGVLLDAISAFPSMLAACDNEVAAAIVADLIKTHLRFRPENNQSAADSELEAIITRSLREANESE